MAAMVDGFSNNRINGDLRFIYLSMIKINQVQRSLSTSACLRRQVCVKSAFVSVKEMLVRLCHVAYQFLHAFRIADRAYLNRGRGPRSSDQDAAAPGESFLDAALAPGNISDAIIHRVGDRAAEEAPLIHINNAAIGYEQDLIADTHPEH